MSSDTLRYEIGVESLDGNTNYDGVLRFFDTFLEALRQFDTVVEEYSQDEQFKTAFIDRWVKGENGDPCPVEEWHPIPSDTEAKS
jgi:hypothetical protein